MHILGTITLLIICSARLNLASDCFYSENIECACEDDTVNCNGTQREYLEVQGVLVNISNIYFSRDLLYLRVNIKNLTFPPEFAFNNFSLKNLSLGNDLQTINDDLFYGLSSSLTSIHLQYNNLGFINNQPFSHLYNLKELKLDSNEISEINSKTFLNLSNLEYLSLSGNKLYQIDSSFLENLPAVQELIISHNNFSKISNINIVSSTLKQLVLQNCSINGSVTKEFLSGVTNLEYADFSANQLTGVESYAMSPLTQLKTLNLSYNLLEKLEQNAFASMYNLRSLDLKNNKLLHIPKTSFLNMTNLKYLDLSGNLLEAVLGEYTSDLHSLESINLKDNNIKIIMTGTFSTSNNLQKLFLTGNSWDCICELSYFVGFLLNNSHIIEVEDIDGLKCATPPSLKGTSLTNIDFTPLNCDNKEETEEDYDYESSSETETTHISTVSMTSTEIHFTTQNITTTNSSVFLFTGNTTISFSPTTEEFKTSTEESSTTKVIQSTTEPIISTTDEIQPISQEITSTEKVQSQTENITSTTKEIQTHKITDPVTSTMQEIRPSSQEITSTTEKIQFQTENISTTKEIQSSTDPVTFTTQEIPSSTQEIGSTTKEIPSSTMEISSTTENSIFATETENIIPTTISQSSTTSFIPIKLTTTSVPKVATNLSVNVSEYSVLGKDFCIRWSLSGLPMDKPTCSIKINSREGRKSKILKCPADGSEIQQCIPSKEVYEFCINIYVKTVPKSKACYKIPVITTVKYSEKLINMISETTPTSLNTTQKIELTTKSIPSIEIPKPSSSDIPVFKVTTFDVIFNNFNSSALLKWRVTKNEPESKCKLTLILSTYHYNHTEGMFKCTNNTYQMLNIKEQNTFKMCILITHDSYKSNLICKSHSGFSYEHQASRTKDDGYKNSSLIAVICLLIVVALIVIVLVLKKLLKKRIEADRYNVYEQEQNVKKRISSQFQQEPCVRYSYTLKEQENV